MRLQVSIEQNALAGFAVAEEKSLASVSSKTIRSSGTKLRARLQLDAQSSLGPKIANAWRMKQYPEGQESAKAAALIYTKAPNIIDAFDKGSLIRPTRGGRYLAIPTPNARRVRGEKVNPRSFEAAGIKLQFIPARRGKPALLVNRDDFASRRGGGVSFRNTTKTGKRRGRSQFTVFFILIPQVKLQKLFDLDQRAQEAQADVAASFARFSQQEDANRPS